MADDVLTVDSLRRALKMVAESRDGLTIRGPMVLLHPGETGILCAKCGGQMLRVVAGSLEEYKCRSCGDGHSSEAHEARLRRWLEAEGCL